MRPPRGPVGRGRVDVVTHDEPGARVEIHTVEGRPLDVVRKGSSLRIGYPQLSFESLFDSFRRPSTHDVVDVSVAVPVGATVSVGVVTADGLVAGTGGSVTVSNVSGSVVTDGTEGDLTVRTVSGEVVSRGHRGSLTAKTVSGDVTASGALTSVSFSSVSGEVTLDLTEQPSSVRASTVSGGVALRLPDPQAVGYALRSTSGAVVVDGVRAQRPAGRKEWSGDRVDRPAPAGAGTVVVKAVSGDVSVVRRVERGRAATDAAADATGEGGDL
ncbi:hypothetical protein GCM10025865_22280 [Paraoerskovia sediminicola]|uniref:DUF4097 domain-containing protein n=1 Tax=Paraoerskovia sediminicola TaxID=1138587 RepID=A0ABM8G459_9CELL|nr:DUF4097 family beta strand repeat-containing protein [Paraoerskovia sediminicola]BDZ42929.1 hypothetical protein GCM10025865_22280 [Paraoerskovia sediminicola]